jgi:trimeric autotransporter adhesin
MPFNRVTIGANTITTTTGGTMGCTNTGAATTQLAGQFVRMADNCGAINETAAANTDFDLGVSTGTDCVVPSGHSAGDTHSSRSGFYELNRLIEQARAYLPANTWLQQQLTSNMNINQTCNAFWNGATVNFYRDSGSQCRNTGEIAAIFDHEWGHGIDDNGINGTISSPGESIADIHAILRLNNSCVGRGFLKNQTCGGYGDACIGTTATGCTGVRDSDFAQHRCNLPHTVGWILNGFASGCATGTPTAAACPAQGSRGPCNRETHCEGQAVAEIAWDLKARDLTAAPFNMDNNTALELTTRLFYLGSQSVAQWYSCGAGCNTAGTCGCGATNGYLLVLAADDDNGSLTDGTPHGTAIKAAFDRHQMGCNTQAVSNSGCSGGPTTAPTTFTATAAAAGDAVDLSWSTVTGATSYNVYRTEGVAQCAFGKVKIANVTGTTFQDTGLLSGRPYSYIVIPQGTNPACLGRATACATATPSAVTCGAVVSVAPISLAVDAGGNGVLQPNESSVVVAPTWRNAGGSSVALTGALTNFTGPAGPTYTINDAAADYGTIPAATNQACTNCYAVTAAAATRPVQHWDTTALETVSPSATTKTWTLHVGDSFTDVPASNGFYRFVETIFHKSVTGGCATGLYCPNDATTREQMAAFVLVSKEGAGYNPPACSAPNLFVDVPETNPFCKFIEELANRQVVAGCQTGFYCPQSPVQRNQMAIFVLRTLDPTLNPPACGTPVFADVPASDPFCRWIEELARRGVVTGCGGGNYCPTASVTRDQMGVFLSLTFGLTLYGL